MKNEQHKQIILDYLNSDLNEATELTQLFYDIIQLKNGFQTKDNLLTFCGYSKDQIHKVDFAYPIDYYRRIREIYPDIENGILCYDYNEHIYGQMINVSNLIAKRILKRF